MNAGENEAVVDAGRFEGRDRDHGRYGEIRSPT